MCNWLLVVSEKGLEAEREMGNSCCRQKTTISVIRRTGSNGNRVNVLVVNVVMILVVVGVIVSILVRQRNKKATGTTTNTSSSSYTLSKITW